MTLKSYIFLLFLFFFSNNYGQELFSPNVELRQTKILDNYLLPFTTKPQSIKVKLVNGYGIFQGDIILFEPNENRDAGIPNTSTRDFRWTNGEIPFEIEDDHGSENIIRDAINKINNQSVLCLRPRNGERAFVRFVNGTGCASAVGRQGFGQRIVVQAGAGGCSEANIMHEILHAAGMHHEQSRSDRDLFVNIDFSNIVAGERDNFDRFTNVISICDYDYASIMHYPTNAFAIDRTRPTITATRAVPVGVILGQRNGLSDCDIRGLANLYPNATTCRPPITGFDLSANQNSDGRLEIFYLEQDYKISHKWQEPANGRWSSSALLGDISNKGKQIKTILDNNGQLNAFYIGTDNRIYYNVQGLNGAWSGQKQLSVGEERARIIEVTKNKSGQLELICIGLDNRIYNFYQNNGIWSSRNLLGAYSNQARNLKIGQNSDGRLEIFYIGTDNGIYHNWQNSSGSGWSGEAFLGVASNKAKELAVAQNNDGRLEVFYIGTDDKLYNNWQQSNGSWSGQNLIAPNNKAKKIEVARNQDGRLELFYIGTDDRLYHNWQKLSGGGWSGEQLLSTNDSKAKKISVARNQDGRLELFYVGMNNQLYHIWQTSPNGGWGTDNVMR